MQPPLTQWICDNCNNDITDKSKAYVIWMDDPDLGCANFKIIHQGVCDNAEDYNCSLPLESFLGDEGREYLLSFLSSGAIKNNLGRDPVIPPYNIDEFVDFFRRVQTPYYEEARTKFKDSKVLTNYFQDNAFGPYLEESLIYIIKGMPNSA